MPFLHDLIGGKDGGLQDTTNAICPKILGVECRDNLDTLGRTHIPPTVADPNTPLEATTEGEETQNSTTPLDLASGDSSEVVELITPPSDQAIEVGHGLGPCGEPGEGEVNNINGNKPISPNLRIFDFGSYNGEGDLS